jgi:lauroyl/myristoyl acyltransferase
VKERVARAFLRFLEAVPLPSLAVFCEAVMFLVYAIDRKHRRIARINLRIAFPEMGDAEADQIIRACYRQMGTSAAEFVHLPRMDAAYIREHFRIEGASLDRPKGILVDFFTRKAYTTFGIARLALAMNAAIHPAFIFRDPARKFHHVLRFGPPLPIDPGAPREEEVARVTRRCNEELEKVIREAPDQWMWFHRRWKTRPVGEPEIYRGLQ